VKHSPLIFVSEPLPPPESLTAWSSRAERLHQRNR
jgi:hypothetical protein